jgi:hypothetical protein
MLAHNLLWFGYCDAPKLFRDFVRGKATVAVEDGNAATYPRKAYNPILRQVPWQILPQEPIHHLLLIARLPRLSDQRQFWTGMRSGWPEDNGG